MDTPQQRLKHELYYLQQTIKLWEKIAKDDDEPTNQKRLAKKIIRSLKEEKQSIEALLM